MNNQITARGWIWERSDRPTPWIGFKCSRCGSVMTYPNNASDGTKCKSCRAANVPIGYFRKVKEVKG